MTPSRYRCYQGRSACDNPVRHSGQTCVECADMGLQGNVTEPYDYHVLAYYERMRMANIAKRNREAIANLRRLRGGGMSALRAHQFTGETHLVAIHGGK